MILFHDVFKPWPLKDRTVQSIITSPPYFQVRKYDIPNIIIGGKENCKHENFSLTGLCEKCGAFKGQYGNEPDFKLYLHHTMLWLEEAWRVLKDDGIIFIVIDDKFSGSNMGRAKGGKHGNQGGIGSKYNYTEIQSSLPADTTFGVKRKSKLCIPEELMVKMRDRGWCIRNRLVWIRTMPESVKDRFSSQSETIIFATKNSKYYFNLDAVKENIKDDTIRRYLNNYNSGKDYEKQGGSMSIEAKRRIGAKFKERYTKIKIEDSETFGSPRSRYHRKTNKPIGFGGGNYFFGGINADNSTYRQKIKGGDIDCLLKNPGNVWLDYYLEIHRQSINRLGVDGYIEDLRRQILSESDIFPPFVEGLRDAHYAPFSSKLVERLVLCSSRAGDIVLDPFVGSGTTLLGTEKWNRNGIGFDLGYAEIQKRRLEEIQKRLPMNEVP